MVIKLLRKGQVLDSPAWKIESAGKLPRLFKFPNSLLTFSFFFALLKDIHRTKTKHIFSEDVNICLLQSSVALQDFQRVAFAELDPFAELCGFDSAVLVQMLAF